MAEIEGGKVEEIEDEEDLRNDEVSTNEEHHECELEEIIEDEMASNTSCGLDVSRVCGE